MDQCEDQGQGVRTKPRRKSRADWIQVLERHRYNSAKICKALGISRYALHGQLRRRGLSLRPIYQYRPQEKWDEIFSLYRTLGDAAKAFGMTRQVFSAMLRRYGVMNNFPRRSDGDTLLMGIDTDVLERLYAEHRSCSALGRVLGVHYKTVASELRRRGITVLTKPRLLENVESERLIEIYRTYGYKGHLILKCSNGTYYDELRRRGIK